MIRQTYAYDDIATITSSSSLRLISIALLLLLQISTVTSFSKKMTSTSVAVSAAAQVDPSIYGKSGDISKHLEGVKQQYDTENKIEFYRQVMGDGTANIHFGKWDNVDLDQEGAYGKASEQMTDYMFELVSSLCRCEGEFKYVDLGSGTGAAALRLVKMHPHIQHATCLNLCEEQNALATKEAAEAGLSTRIEVVTGTYEDAPLEDNTYDACFSQDAFVHAFEKKQAFREAFRITKPGGAFVWCDLMCGAGEGVSDEELQTFAATNMVNDWLSPEENVAACQAVGWEDVEFVDLTADIRISFQLMLKKVEKILADGNPAGIDEKLLTSYQTNLGNRITQVDRGVFKWGVVHAKKPVAN